MGNRSIHECRADSGEADTFAFVEDMIKRGENAVPISIGLAFVPRPANANAACDYVRP
jgi:hypothetical protein